MATPTASGRLTCCTGSLLQRLLPWGCEHMWRRLGWALPFPAREGEFIAQAEAWGWGGHFSRRCILCWVLTP